MKKLIFAVLVTACLSTAAMALDVLSKPVNTVLDGVLNPVARSLGFSSDKIKILENGDTWSNVLYDKDGKEAAIDIFTVTNNKTSTPESIEVKQIIRKEAPLDANGKAGTYKQFSIWYLQKNDGTIYFYGDTIGNSSIDPTFDIIYTQKELKNIKWYDQPIMFIPGKLKKDKSWNFVSPSGIAYTCTIEKLVKLQVDENNKLETWRLKYTVKDNPKADTKDDTKADAKAEESTPQEYFRWFGRQISFYFRSGNTNDVEDKPLSIIADLLLPAS